MPRFAPIITMDDFKEKCNKYLGLNSEEGFDPYGLPETINKDLQKVNFSFENYEYENNEGFEGYPCGFVKLPNNLPVLFVNAGGDWEHPICFIIYWNGEKMRGYIPEDGNIYNKKEKCAYGSEDDWDNLPDIDDLPKPDIQKIYNDIINRIQIR